MGLSAKGPTQRYPLIRKVPQVLTTKRVIRIRNHFLLPNLALLFLRLRPPQAASYGRQRTGASLLNQLVGLVLRAVPSGPRAWQLEAPGRDPILHLLDMLLHHAVERSSRAV